MLLASHEPTRRAGPDRGRVLAGAGAAAARRFHPCQRRAEVRPPDLIDVRRGADGRVDLEVLPLRLRQAGRARQRSPHLLQGTRVAASVLHVQGMRRDLGRRVAHVPQHRLAARGTPEPGHPLGGRRDRVAGARAPDRSRRRARGEAGEVALARLGAVRRQRDGRGLDVGGARARLRSTSSTT